MWNRVKKMFKKKPKIDTHVSFDPRVKEPLIYDLPSNMGIHTKLIGMADTPKGSQAIYKWEVNGVIVEAYDVLGAQRKYLRSNK